MDVNEIFNHALSSLTNPTKTASDLAKKKLTLVDGAVAVALGALVTAVITAIMVLFVVSWVGTMFSAMPMMGWSAPIGAGMGIATAIGLLIGIPIGMVIAWLVASFLVWVVASVLGGKGDFAKFASTWAFPMAAVFALSWIPIVNWLAELYALYLLYVFLQPTMKMDSNKAAITVIAIIVLSFVLAALFGSAVMLTVPAR
jgi:large-conductance mechanosensitive channel